MEWEETFGNKNGSSVTMKCVWTYEIATIVMLPLTDGEMEAWFPLEGP